MLARIELHDFCQFERVTIDLKKQGLVWVAGENKDTTAASSNGAGKSTISKAITWVLYGKVIDRRARNDEIGDAIIREGQKQAVVYLFFDDGSYIRRQRTKSKPSLQLFLSDGTEWTGGDIQERIIEIVGVDFHGFKNAYLFGQNDTSRFAAPDISDQKRKEMLHKLLRADVLRDCSAIAKVKYSEKKKEVESIKIRQEKVALSFSMLDIERNEARQLEWETERESNVEKLRIEARELKERAGGVAAGADSLLLTRSALTRAELALEKLTASCGDLSVIQREWEAAVGIWNKASREIHVKKHEFQTITYQLNELSGDTCETCSAPLSEGAPKKKIDDLNAKRLQIKNEFEEVQKFAKSSKEKTVEIEKRLEEENAKREKKASLQARVSALKLKVSEENNALSESKILLEAARNKISDLKEFKSYVNPFTEIVETARTKAEEMTKECERLEKLYRQEDRALRRLKFWVDGFGSQGLQSFLLDEVMPYLTERANHYLETLSDGDIEVSFSTQKETKSSTKEEIQISWVIEGVANKTPSGGQQRKIEIATDFAFMDLAATREGGALDIFIADEIFDGLDNESQERALLLLADLKKRRGTIFVISHSSTMSEIFEHSLTVVREGGISRIEMEG